MARAMGKRNTETQQAPPGATEIPISVGAETSIHCGTYVSSLPGLRVYCGGAGSQGWHPGLSRRAGSARAFALAYQYVQKRAPVTDPLPPHVFAPTCGTCKRGAPRQLESPAIAHNWPALVFSSRRKGFEALILGADSMNSRVAIVRESARSALECGSLLPLSPPRRDQLAGRAAVCPVWAGEAASKLAGSKRQQAAALQSPCGASRL